MATAVRSVELEQGDELIPAGKELIDYEDALEQLTEDQTPPCHGLRHEYSSHRERCLHCRGI